MRLVGYCHPQDVAAFRKALDEKGMGSIPIQEEPALDRGHWYVVDFDEVVRMTKRLFNRHHPPLHAGGEGGGVMFYWLSFCDPNKPAGSQFLGVSVVPALDFAEAVTVAHAMRCNPGGEVLGAAIPDELTVPGRFVGRLMSKAEAQELDALWDAKGDA